METITIKGATARAVSPEGQTADIPVQELVRRIAPARMHTGGVVLPDGVVAVLSQGPVTVWVHQTPPRVFSFKWIAKGSRAKFGPGTKYRTVRLALPYLVVFAVFSDQQFGPGCLSQFNECFFRNDPLSSLDDELHYPALLNCSKFTPPDGHPLAWICTQHLNYAELLGQPDVPLRMRAGFKALMQCLLESGFNYSSEEHEGSSWFTESAGIDPRVAAVEKWEAATAANPMFVLEVPWLSTGHSVRQVAERIFQYHEAERAVIQSSADIARVIFNHADV